MDGGEVDEHNDKKITENVFVSEQGLNQIIAFADEFAQKTISETLESLKRQIEATQIKLGIREKPKAPSEASKLRESFNQTVRNIRETITMRHCCAFFVCYTLLLYYLSTILLVDPSDGRLARRRAAPPVPFFSSSYPSTIGEEESQSLKDYYDGNGAHSTLLLRSSELVIAFYYATWSLDSKLSRNAFQNVAKSFDDCDDLSFAAVNCFTTHGQCRNSYKVSTFPVLVAYVSANLKSVRDIVLIYNGELADDYIRRWILYIRKSMIRIISRVEFIDFYGQYDGAVIAYFPVSSVLKQSWRYREYFLASLIASQYEELLGGVRFAIVTEWRLAHWLKFTYEGHIQLFQQGEPPIHFPLERNYSSLEIINWIRDYSLKHSTSLHWLVPEGNRMLKSEQLLMRLQSAPTLILFTARQPLYAHKSEVSIVEQTAMEYLDCSEAYSNQIQQTLQIREKYRRKRMKLLEMDHLACTTIKNFKKSLAQVIACCHHKYNELMDYCGRCVGTTSLNSAPQNIHHDECTNKAVLFRLKSSSVCNDLFDSSSFSSEQSSNQSVVVGICCLLTEMESVYGERRQMTSQKMQQRCNNYRMRRGVVDRISTSDFYSESAGYVSYGDYTYDSSHFEKNNKRSYTNSHYAYSRADNNESADDRDNDNKSTLGQQQKPKQHQFISNPQQQQQYDSSSVAHLSCSYNNSLRFMTIDTQHYEFLIEKLAVNSPNRTRSKSSVNDESNVIIVDGKNEQIFLMQETLSREALKRFITSYHNATLSRHQITEEKLPKQLKANLNVETNEEFTNDKKNINKINTASANTFMNDLLNKNTSRDMVVLLINGAWHGPSSSVFYIFHTVAYYFKPFESMIQFVMLDVSKNELPWQFKMDRLPSVLFFPSKRESASSVMPRNWPMSVPGLISFIISRCGTELRWRIALSSCSSVCMRKNTIMLKRHARIINNHIHQLRTLQNSFTLTNSQSSLLKALILRRSAQLRICSKVLRLMESVKSFSSHQLIERAIQLSDESHILRSLFETSIPAHVIGDFA